MALKPLKRFFKNSVQNVAQFVNKVLAQYVGKKCTGKKYC